MTATATPTASTNGTGHAPEVPQGQGRPAPEGAVASRPSRKGTDAERALFAVTLADLLELHGTGTLAEILQAVAADNQQARPVLAAVVKYLQLTAPAPKKPRAAGKGKSKAGA
jgi:hypothetical protein